MVFMKCINCKYVSVYYVISGSFKIHISVSRTAFTIICRQMYLIVCDSVNNISGHVRFLFCFVSNNLYVFCKTPSLMGFFSTVSLLLSSPILNGNKVVVQPHSYVQSCIMP